jgi:hypothetical protein
MPTLEYPVKSIAYSFPCSACGYSAFHFATSPRLAQQVSTESASAITGKRRARSG